MAPSMSQYDCAGRRGIPLRGKCVREADYDAYDLDDPKHPDWEDRAAERADLERKRAKEDAGPA